jgi:hypothetical protein
MQLGLSGWAVKIKSYIANRTQGGVVPRSGRSRGRRGKKP